MTHDAFETISADQLAHATGGAGFDIGGMLQMVGQMADKAGAGGKGSQIAGMIGPLAQNLMGMFGGGGGGGGGGGAASTGG